MKMPFKGADVRPNLRESAGECRGSSSKVEDERYIRIKLKSDRKNILISVENRYTGELIKTKGGELKGCQKRMRITMGSDWHQYKGQQGNTMEA